MTILEEIGSTPEVVLRGTTWRRAARQGSGGGSRTAMGEGMTRIMALDSHTLAALRNLDRAVGSSFLPRDVTEGAVVQVTKDPTRDAQFRSSRRRLSCPLMPRSRLQWTMGVCGRETPIPPRLPRGPFPGNTREGSTGG